MWEFYNSSFLSGVSATGQQSLYPPPPDFYRLYRDDADGNAERPLPPVPPQPVEETYQMFGEMHTIEPGIPALQAQSLFHTMANGSIDIKQELLHMNKELLFSFQELLSVLIDQPSSSSKRIADIGALLRQMHHLLNMLRPHQACATLAQTLQSELHHRQEAVTDLQKQVAAAQRCLEGCTIEFKDEG
ncbi:TPA: hypothetical protein ACH3X3_008143 [Trebouxia sp. C0006]